MPLDAIKTFTIWLATGTEAIAGLVIAVAVLEAASRTVLLLFSHTARTQSDGRMKQKRRFAYASGAGWRSPGI